MYEKESLVGLPTGTVEGYLVLESELGHPLSYPKPATIKFEGGSVYTIDGPCILLCKMTPSGRTYLSLEDSNHNSLIKLLLPQVFEGQTVQVPTGIFVSLTQGAS